MTDLSELTAQVRSLIPILEAMGLEVVEAERGRVAARIPAGPNANHFGAMYAGSLFSVAEVLGGLMTRSSFPVEEGFVPIVKGSTIDFLRPATTAALATAMLSEEEIARTEAAARDHGKAEFRLRTEITDEAGEVVAATDGTYQLRRL